MKLRVRARVLAAATALLATAFGGTAHADLTGVHIFTKKDTVFRVTDVNSSFDAQITWGESGKPVAWSFVLSPAVQAIAVSDMTCNARLPSFPNWSAHKVQRVGYIWHAYVPGPHQVSQNWHYALSGNCTFRHNVSGGGTATLRFMFQYRLSNFDGARQSSMKDTYTSDVELQYEAASS